MLQNKIGRTSGATDIHEVQANSPKTAPGPAWERELTDIQGALISTDTPGPMRPGRYRS